MKAKDSIPEGCRERAANRCGVFLLPHLYRVKLLNGTLKRAILLKKEAPKPKKTEEQAASDLAQKIAEMEKKQAQRRLFKCDNSHTYTYDTTDKEIVRQDFNSFWIFTDACFCEVKSAIFKQKDAITRIKRLVLM